MRRTLMLVPSLPLVGVGFVLGQVLRAAHRRDLPSFPNQDCSGSFGDPSLPHLRIVAVGDSSLTGPGVRQIDNLWLRRIALDYADRHHVELISLAVGGSKAHDVIEGQLAEAVRLQPDVAVVSVGSNDSIRGVPVSGYKDRLDHIITELEAAAGAVMVFGMGDLGSIPRLPRSLRPFLTLRSRVFNDAAREVALRHPRCIKVYTLGRTTTAFWEDRSLFAEDQFHAGDEGHRVFAEEARPAFDAAYLLAMARRS